MPKTCGKCGGKALRRINRIGYWEEYILPKFGFYPWECVICRVRKYYRDDGQRPTGRETADALREAGSLKSKGKSES